MVSSQALFAISLFIFNVLIARYLGDEAFGKYSFAIALTNLLAVFSHFGLEGLATRDLVLDKSLARKYFNNAFVLQIWGSVFMLLLAALTVNFSQQAQDTRIVVTIIAFGTIATSFVALCRSIFRAFERMEWDTIAAVVGTCFLLGAGLFAIRAGYGLIDVVCIYSAAQIFMFLVSLTIVIIKFIGIDFSLDVKFWKYLAITTIPFALNAFLVQIYFRIDTVILSFAQDKEVVGWYNAAFTLAVIPLSVIITGLGRALFPSVTHAFAFSKDLYKVLVNRAVRYSVILLVPMGMGVTLLAGKIISIVFGTQYANSVSPLKLLIWAGIVLFINILYISILEATNKQTKATLVLGIGAAMNTVLSFVLISQFGLIGAAISTLLTQLTCVLISCYMVGQIMEIKALLNSFIKPIIASTLMGIFIFYFGYLHIILLGFIAVIIYFLSFYLLRGITEEDLKTFRSLIDTNKERQN